MSAESDKLLAEIAHNVQWGSQQDPGTSEDPAERKREIAVLYLRNRATTLRNLATKERERGLHKIAEELGRLARCIEQGKHR